MSPKDAKRRLSPDYETPTSRVVILGLLFAALVVIGVFTVLRPELEDAEEASTTAAPAVAEGVTPGDPALPGSPGAAPASGAPATP